MAGLLRRISTFLILLNIFSQTTHCAQDNRSLQQAISDHNRGSSVSLQQGLNSPGNQGSLLQVAQHHAHSAPSHVWSFTVNAGAQYTQLCSNSLLNNTLANHQSKIDEVLEKHIHMTKNLSYKGLKRNNEALIKELQDIDNQIRIEMLRFGPDNIKIQAIIKPMHDHGMGVTDIRKQIPADLLEKYDTYKQKIDVLGTKSLLLQHCLAHNRKAEFLRLEEIRKTAEIELKKISEQPIEKLVAIEIPALQQKIRFFSEVAAKNVSELSTSSRIKEIELRQSRIKAYEDAVSENEIYLAAAQNIVNVHCERYTQDLQKIIELYLQSSTDKTLNTQIQKLITSMQQSISEKCDLRHSFNHLLSEPVKKMFAHMNIPQEVISPFKCNSLQRELAEQIHAALNNSGELFAQYHNDPNIRAYIEATAHMCITSLDSIRFGTAQEMLAKYEISLALQESAQTAIGAAKGLAKTGLVIGAMTFPALRCILIIDGIIDLFCMDSSTGPKLMNNFANATQAQKAEMAGSIFGGLFAVKLSYPPETNTRSQNAAQSVADLGHKEHQWLKKSHTAEQALIRTPEGLAIPNKAPFLTSLKEISTKPANTATVSGTARKTAGSAVSNAGAKLTELEVKAASEASTVANVIKDEVRWGHWVDLKKVTHNGREYASINGRLYTQHAIERMTPIHYGYAVGGAEGRGIPINVVEDIISNGQITEIRISDNIERVTKSIDRISVVLEKDIVVTVRYKDK